MRRALPVSLAVAVSLAAAITWTYLSAAPWRHRISGEVFIITVEGTIESLAYVEVRAYRRDVLQEHFAAKKKAAAAPLATLQTELEAAPKFAGDARADKHSGLIRDLPVETIKWLMEDYEGGEYFFGDLPPPLASTRSDVAGRFQLDASGFGALAVIASAERSIGAGDIERDYWAVRIGDAATTTLSNENLTTARSQDSLLTTYDWRAMSWASPPDCSLCVWPPPRRRRLTTELREVTTATK